MTLKVLCLMGPTASGKTDLSLELASSLSCELISVDSAMVYRGMDIGTAKPSKEERAKIAHHLIDLLLPSEAYSAAKFQDDALKAIHAIHQKGKIPLLVGGTMLYFKALQQGLSPLPPANNAIRTRLSEEAAIFGWKKMHERLAVIDPEASQQIRPSDSQRIQRALEVYEVTQTPLSQLWETRPQPISTIEYINIGLMPEERADLHQRIASRFQQMLQQGFIEEVASLRKCQDLHINLPSMRSVGYRQIWHYLDDKLSYAEMVDKGIAATRQLAKRQLTWLRSWENVTWFKNDEPQLKTKLLDFVKENLFL